MAGWDDDNFEPELIKTAPAFSNKWEGEDEEDEVKESWEDVLEEKKEESVENKPTATSAKVSKKKTLQEKIAEKEKMKQEEFEKRSKVEDEDELTPEEAMRLQQEAELNWALETTFGDKTDAENAELTTSEKLLEVSNSISKNILQFSKSEEYPTFVENIVRGVCATLNSYDLKKVKTTIDNLYLEKQKLEKGDKTKKSKGKGKAKLKMEGDKQLNQYSAYTDDFVEYDDFM